MLDSLFQNTLLLQQLIFVIILAFWQKNLISAFFITLATLTNLIDDNELLTQVYGQIVLLFICAVVIILKLLHLRVDIDPE